MKAFGVISGVAQWSIERGDALEWLRGLQSDSMDLVFGSPPYEQARLYLEGGKNLGVARKTEAWVSWMVEVYREASRVCRGLVAFVVEGQTRNFKYSAGPALLMADLHRAGFNLRKPPVFHRVGIPGSGGPDWLRNDWEWIICVTRPGKLPWSDNTAMGHPPKWAPGGAMSHRLTDGSRRDQWGRDGSTGNRAANGERKEQTNAGVIPCGGCGETDESKRCIGCLHEFSAAKVRLRVKGGSPKDSCKGRRVPAGTTVNGDVLHADAYLPPVLANPGNVIACKVGGGLMGHQLAHENEAPFPESLADWFTLSFCPPGGIVADCFAGSGTTLASAVKNGRRGIGCDLRQSQVELTTRRMVDVQPLLTAQA